MRAQRLVLLGVDRQVPEQVLASVEERRDALRRQQLRVGLTLDQEALHLHELQIGEVRQDEQRDAEQRQLRAETGAADAGTDLHGSAQRYPNPYSLRMQANSGSTFSNFLRMLRMWVLMVLFVTRLCMVAFISVS